MFQFAHKEYLMLLALIPVLGILFFIVIILKKRAVKSFGEYSLISLLMPDVSASRPVVKFILVMVGLAFLILAIAGPQVGSKLGDVKHKGVELIVCLDVSNSMLAEDVQPNRLEKAKQVISKMIDNLKNDKFGLIIFGGDAYVQLPITTDYGAAKMFLASAGPNSIPVQGTAIGSSLEMAIKSFTSEKDKNRAIVLISDGENHEDDAVEMSGEAAKKGIIIHTMGIGKPEGSPIPRGGKLGGNNFMTDNQGQVIITKLNETNLEQMASSGNGIYIRVNNTQSAVKSLFDEINKMEKTEIQATVYSEYEERFQYVVAVALLFLIVEFFIRERKNKYLKNINIFRTRMVK
ncbi:MAG: VWA domain-containing protein [Bacteroidia bacterium]|nr:VWA domain-containing protein [Bacteroidia bacterium]